MILVPDSASCLFLNLKEGFFCCLGAACAGPEVVGKFHALEGPELTVFQGHYFWWSSLCLNGKGKKNRQNQNPDASVHPLRFHPLPPCYLVLKPF
jgi:hypothetical protein